MTQLNIDQRENAYSIQFDMRRTDVSCANREEEGDIDRQREAADEERGGKGRDEIKRYLSFSVGFPK